MVLTFGLVFSSVSPFLPVSSIFFMFFPFFHQVNCSNLPPVVWHWLPWPCCVLCTLALPRTGPTDRCRSLTDVDSSSARLDSILLGRRLKPHFLHLALKVLQYFSLTSWENSCQNELSCYNSSMPLDPWVSSLLLSAARWHRTYKQLFFACWISLSARTRTPNSTVVLSFLGCSWNNFSRV